MTVYVDYLFNTEWADKKKWPYKQSCHMIADDDEELHAMAARIGLRRTWAQQSGPDLHYDLVPAMRVRALRAGAQSISALELSSLILHKRVRAKLRTT